MKDLRSGSSARRNRECGADSWMGCRRATDWPWRCGTSTTCRTRRSRKRSASHWAAPSRMFIAVSRSCARRTTRRNERSRRRQFEVVTRQVTDKQVEAGLRSLRTRAPEGLANKVLDRLGLGDAYVRVEGPIGPLFVAFGRDGISLVERADATHDAGDFEAMFRATLGRPVRRIERAPELIERVIDARLWGKT